MNEFDLVVNQELRQNMVERVEVLEQVKEILTLGTTDFVTVELAAQYYEVDKNTIEEIMQKHWDEIYSNGLRYYSNKELRKILNPVKNTKSGQILPFKVSPKGLLLIPRKSLLKIGVLLMDSNISERVRTKILDTIFNTENEINNIRTEQQICEDIAQAILNGDYRKESLLLDELSRLRNKR